MVKENEDGEFRMKRLSRISLTLIVIVLFLIILVVGIFMLDRNFLTGKVIESPTKMASDGIIVNYQFNNNFLDSSGNGYKGVSKNGAKLILSPVWDYAGYFDGVNDWLYNTKWTLPDVTNNFTFAFWANPLASRNPTLESIAGGSGSKNQRYAIYPSWTGGTSLDGHAGAGVSIGTNGISVFEHGKGYLPSVLVYNEDLNGWHFIVVRYKEGVPSLFVDGKFIKTGLKSGKIVHPSLNLGEEGTGYGYYKGYLDDVKIYGKALDDSEIDKLYNAPPKGYADGIIDNTKVFGWAIDTNNELESVQVDFYLDGLIGRGTFLGSTIANVNRPDLPYKGAHGFEFVIPSTFRDSKPHTIYAFAKDLSTQRYFKLIGLPMLNSPSAEVLTSPEVVFDYTTNKCEDIDIPDAPARAFRAGGKVNLIASHYVNRRMTGDSLNNVVNDCRVIYNSHNDKDFLDFSNHEWISGLYAIDEKKVNALIHDEWYAYLIDSRCTAADYVYGWINSITLVKSTDGGASFVHPKDFVVRYSNLTWSNTFSCNANNFTRYGAFGPSNIVKKDNYYYAMFAQESEPGKNNAGTCLMRTTSIGEASTWEVWDGDTFKKSKIEDCWPISKDSIGRMHHSITFNKYLNTYVLTGYRGGNNEGFYFSMSKNLIDWSPAILLMNVNGTMAAYPSLLDPEDTSRNFEFTNRESYVYYTKFNGGLDRDLVRQKVKFSY